MYKTVLYLKEQHIIKTKELKNEHKNVALVNERKRSQKIFACKSSSCQQNDVT